MIFNQGIMRKGLIVFSFLAMIFAALGSFAQDVQFTAQARQVVSVGETFSLVYSVNGQGSGFQAPRITGFDILSGPSSSTSSSIRMVNGQTAMTVTNSYTYVLMAQREGTFDIPPARINVNGKQHSSNTVTVKVVKGSAPARAGGQGRSGQTGKGDQGNPNDVYVKAFASNHSPRQGEGIVVTYKIFTKVHINQLDINKLSSFPGFWSQNLMKENDRLQQTTQVIDGEQYVVADIRKLALFPLKSGALTIDPLELTCVAQVRRQGRTRTGDPFFDDFFNDAFFNTGVANVEKNLRSNPLTINVRPLPEQGKPADFSGAVGTFTIKAELDRTRLKTNDAVTLKITVTGKGNLQLIDKLPAVFPPDFESYDPKVTSNIQTTVNGISGNQVFEYLLIPRKAGTFAIKSLNFSYFDLDKDKYVTLNTPAFTLEVEKGTGESTAISSYSGTTREEIKYIGSDIRHIRNAAPNLRPAGDRFFGSTLFWLLYLTPIVVFLALMFFWRKRATRRSNQVLMKNLKATKTAKKRLQSAEKLRNQGKQDEFYVAISQAIWGYLSDKFSIPPAELSMDSVKERLETRSVDPELISEFINTLNNTEFARFAPGEKTVNMERIYMEALQAISKMERSLR